MLPLCPQVDQFSRQVQKLERGLTPNDLVPKLREEVNRWQVREPGSMTWPAAVTAEPCLHLLLAVSWRTVHGSSF